MFFEKNRIRQHRVGIHISWRQQPALSLSSSHLGCLLRAALFSTPSTFYPPQCIFAQVGGIFPFSIALQAIQTTSFPQLNHLIAPPRLEKGFHFIPLHECAQ